MFIYLVNWTLLGAPPEEMSGYLREAICRIVAVARELTLLPTGARVLEIGSNPYHLTLLMRDVRPDLDWACTNWFGAAENGNRVVQCVVHTPTNTRQDFTSALNNIERTPLPFTDESFDCVVFCEVFEHLFEDPTRSLEHIHRVLRPGGHLILTTPNPARLRNIVKLVTGRTIFDAISGYGPHGRHNREYSASELAEVLRAIGYHVERRSTLKSGGGGKVDQVAAAVGYGDYHFFIASRRPGVALSYRPGWLYRSFPGAKEPSTSSEMHSAGDSVDVSVLQRRLLV